MFKLRKQNVRDLFKLKRKQIMGDRKLLTESNDINRLILQSSSRSQGENSLEHGICF